MVVTVNRFLALVEQRGSPVVFHRESGGEDCPCRTPEGFRDPVWHVENPTAPICNELGILNSLITEHSMKAFVQPATGGMRGRQRVAERIEQMFQNLGEFDADDQFAIFPVTAPDGSTLDFDAWGVGGEDYIEYDGRRFVVVAVDKLADIDGDPNHHWELGLRLISAARPA